jgi:hypothetical protein
MQGMTATPRDLAGTPDAAGCEAPHSGGGAGTAISTRVNDRKASTTVEIGDLHYFAAPAVDVRSLGAGMTSPRRRRAARLLAASAGALLWIGLLLAGVAAD